MRGIDRDGISSSMSALISTRTVMACVRCPPRLGSRSRSSRCFRVFTTRGPRGFAGAGEVCRFAWVRGGNSAWLAMEPGSVSWEPRARILWRRVVLLRFSEAAGKGQQLADQLDDDTRPQLGLLCGRSAVFDLQRGFEKREPLGFQLPAEWDRELRDRAVRSARALVHGHDLQDLSGFQDF